MHNRRDFLKMTTAAGAAVVLPASAFLPLKPGRHEVKILEPEPGHIPQHDVRTFDMLHDAPKHLHYGNVKSEHLLVNERIEGFYWHLCEIIWKEKGPVKWVMAHPFTISHMMAFKPAWKEGKGNFYHLRENPDATLWLSGQRGFAIWEGSPLHGSPDADVWAHVDYPSYWYWASGHPRSYIDRMDFMCEKGSFRMEAHWENLQ